MYPLSNNASRFAVNRKPLKTFNRSASLVQSFQGFAWPYCFKEYVLFLLAPLAIIFPSSTSLER